MSCRELTNVSRRGRAAVISFFGESRREYGLMSYLYEIIFALLANTLQCPHHPSRPALPIPTLTAPYAKLLPASANGRLPSDTWALTRTLSTLWLHLLIQFSTICGVITVARHYFGCWETAVSKTDHTPVPTVPMSSLWSCFLTKPFLVNPCILGIADGDHNTAVPQEMLVTLH